jgi:preprotein translocase subunit YajC
VTIGGLYGTITRLSDDDVELQVDSSTTLRFLKTSIARVVVVDEPTAEEQNEAQATLQSGEEDPQT